MSVLGAAVAPGLVQSQSVISKAFYNAIVDFHDIDRDTSCYLLNVDNSAGIADHTKTNLVIHKRNDELISLYMLAMDKPKLDLCDQPDSAEFEGVCLKAQLDIDLEQAIVDFCSADVLHEKETEELKRLYVPEATHLADRNIIRLISITKRIAEKTSQVIIKNAHAFLVETESVPGQGIYSALIELKPDSYISVDLITPNVWRSSTNSSIDFIKKNPSHANILALGLNSFVELSASGDLMLHEVSGDELFQTYKLLSIDEFKSRLLAANEKLRIEDTTLIDSSLFQHLHKVLIASVIDEEYKSAQLEEYAFNLKPILYLLK
jgi:hypothetical protein